MCSQAGCPGPAHNQLLSNISSEEYVGLLPHLHTVRLSLGDVIDDTHGSFGYAYFPTTCVVSLICSMENGGTAEVALIGNDGLLGTSLFLGGRSVASQAVVGIAGEALRIKASVLKDQFTRGGSFQRTLLHYTGALIAQISLTAACNRVHTLEKRFCRWLLLIRDRTNSDEMVMTQEFIANMLGGRRETVTVAAGRLQDAGLIRYSRGKLSIVNRRALEEAVCECYRAVNTECAPMVAPPRKGVVTVFEKSRAARA